MDKLKIIFSSAWKYLAPIVKYLLAKIFMKVLETIQTAIGLAAAHKDWTDIQKTQFVRDYVYRSLKEYKIDWSNWIVNILIELVYAQRKT